MITLTERHPGSGCMYELHAYQAYQSEQARFLEKTRRNFEAVSKRYGHSHSWTKFWGQECKREAGYLISGAYCSGASGWGIV